MISTGSLKTCIAKFPILSVFQRQELLTWALWTPGLLPCSQERVSNSQFLPGATKQIIRNYNFRTLGTNCVITHLSLLKAFLIAIVVPDVETLGTWAQKRGIVGSFEELCKNKVGSKVCSSPPELPFALSAKCRDPCPPCPLNPPRE